MPVAAAGWQVGAPAGSQPTHPQQCMHAVLALQHDVLAAQEGAGAGQHLGQQDATRPHIRLLKQGRKEKGGPGRRDELTVAFMGQVECSSACFSLPPGPVYGHTGSTLPCQTPCRSPPTPLLRCLSPLPVALPHAVVPRAALQGGLMPPDCCTARHPTATFMPLTHLGVIGCP